jgi:glycine C-acetyltransferase
LDRTEAAALSLADFHFSDSDDPLEPAQDFTDWRQEVAWATALYEQSLAAGPVPRTQLVVDGRPTPVLNLASYNYLGLAQHPRTVGAAKVALDHYGTGACGSPILSGMTDVHRALERKLATFLGYEDVMLFNSGFGGALGMLAGLLRRDDVAVMDARCHVSLIEGAKVSGARLAFFDHNDPASLDALLTRHADRRRIVVTEGIFSMDGDMADLPRLVPVIERHGVGLVIDEAHSILTVGPNGRGVTEHFDLEGKAKLKYATFSKAFAAAGGFVAGPARTLAYLRFFANSYGFSCALPPAMTAAVLAGLEVATSEPGLRATLQGNAAYFRSQLHSLGLSTGDSVSQVVPIIVGSNRQLLYELAHALRARGVFVAIADYPTVPEGSLRFRCSITAAHTRQDLDDALRVIAETVVPHVARAP